MPATATARWAISLAQSVAAGLPRRRAATRNLYEVLGLPPGADEGQIKAAYRELARRLHPDVNAADATSAERLCEINHAYETLSDPRMRSAYDHALAWRRTEMRRHYRLFAASTAVTFVVTLVAVSYLVRWHLRSVPQIQPSAMALASQPPARTTTVAMPSTTPTVAGTDSGSGLPPQAAEGALWSTFRDPRFDFVLRYPAGVFAFDPAQSDANVHTFVSRDHRAIFRIVAAENSAGISLGGFRSRLIRRRYAGASLERTPRRRHWFALAGTKGDEAFMERVTFSCDGKFMHGWQMRYPASQRATYDGLAKLVLRNHPHGNGPGAGCEDHQPKRRGKPEARRTRD
jgi:hypothetical protein